MSEPIAIIQGDSPTFRFQVTSLSTNEAFDLTNFLISFFIKRSLQDPDAAAIYEGTLSTGVSIPNDLKDGILDVTIPAVVTQQIRFCRLYPFYFRLTNSFDATQIFTPIRGMFLATLPNTE